MNDPLAQMLSRVTDARRQQAKRYDLANTLLLCSFGFCAEKFYKALYSFIDERFALLQAAFIVKNEARAGAVELVEDRQPG